MCHWWCYKTRSKRFQLFLTVLPFGKILRLHFKQFICAIWKKTLTRSVDCAYTCIAVAIHVYAQSTDVPSYLERSNKSSGSYWSRFRTFSQSHFSYLKAMDFMSRFLVVNLLFLKFQKIANATLICNPWLQNELDFMKLYLHSLEKKLVGYEL